MIKLCQEITRLPTTPLVVFYKWKTDQPDEKILRLSDSFPEGKKSDIEVRVRMMNINYGKNRKLMEACKPLMEYSWLVAEVRKNNKTNDEKGFSSWIDRAITDMPEDFVIKPFLEAHRTEVKGMLLEEYNETEVMELFKEEGRIEGREEGQIMTLVGLARRKYITIEQAAEEAGMSVEEFLEKIKLV